MVKDGIKFIFPFYRHGGRLMEGRNLSHVVALYKMKGYEFKKGGEIDFKWNGIQDIISRINPVLSYGILLSYPFSGYIERLIGGSLFELGIWDAVFLGFKNFAEPEYNLVENGNLIDNFLKKQKQILRINLPDKKYNTSFKGIKSFTSKKEYIKKAAMIKEYIENGDIYQANLSQMLSFRKKTDGIKIFQNLVTMLTPPYCGFLRLGEIEVVSASPERLLFVKDGTAESLPIAGTRKRGKNLKDDKNLKRELRLSEKENSEHIMLVDLVRNDLGRVCVYGCVDVTEERAIEQYPYVWHIVSRVKGRLKKNIHPLTPLFSLFPGGTITGVPKIMCINILNMLENVERGIYTGSMGYLLPSGEVDFNILIRSLFIRREMVYYGCGGGVVWDSDPYAEYEESLTKASFLLNILRA